MARPHFDADTVQDGDGDTGKRLRQLKSKIITQWETAVREVVPDVCKDNKRILDNSLPDFLEALAKALTSRSKISEEFLRLSRVHGRSRAEIPEYSLRQVLLEYRYLRRTIVALLPAPRESLERIHDSIDQAIAEAGEEFHRQNLLQETEDLEKAESAIENLKSERRVRKKFVLTLSHDLRTPLNAARMAAELLGQKGTDQDQRRSCQMILKNIDRIDRMIQDLLDANAIMAGKQFSLELATVDLFEIATEVADSFAAVHGDRFFVQGGPVAGRWDKRYLARAIENLLSNAVKYGDSTAPIRVMISENGEMASVSVFNLGKPIPKEDQATLFDEFIRVKSEENREKDGWGIGLSLVRGVAEAHGGKIEVQSPFEEGTLFKLTIPKDHAGTVSN